MSDVMKPPLEPEDLDAPDDPIARLIRRAGPRPAVPEERRDRIRSIVRVGWRKSLERRRRRAVFIVAEVAVALLVAIGAGFLLRERLRVGAVAIGSVMRAEGRVKLSDGRVAGEGSVLAAGLGLTTGPDGRAALRLNGGTSVRLDRATDLRLISARVFDLRHGAVYFDTVGRSSRTEAARGSRASDAAGAPPLIEIRTGLGLVRDVGTQFEVRIAGDRLRVSVREGAVALARDGRTYTVPAGTRLGIGREGAIESGGVVPGVDEWDWVLAVAPPFELDGRTLRDYLDWLSRETGWTVRYADSSIAVKAATVTLHGSTSGLRPDQTPAAVLPTCGLRHRLDGQTLIIEHASAAGEPR